MKNRKAIFILIPALILVGVFYYNFIFLTGDFFTPAWKNEENRKALINMHKKLSVGDDYKKVLENFWVEKSESNRLTLSAESPNHWEISMPSEVFATDWRLYVYFQDNKVTGYRIRTTDGMSPPNIPKDVGNTNE